MSDTPKSAHTPLPSWKLPANLEKAAHEIALLMALNGFEKWQYGPIADRRLVIALLAQRDDLLAALEKVSYRIERGAPLPDTTAIARAAIARVKEGK